MEQHFYGLNKEPTRSLKKLLETAEHLEANKIGLMSLEEKIDTSSAAGKFISHVFGEITHFERRLIVERTKDGIHAARLKERSQGSLGSIKILWTLQ